MKFILLPRQNLFKNISTPPVFSGDAFEHWTIGFHPSTVEWCNCLRRIIGLNMASAHLGWLPAVDGIPSKLWWKLGRSLQYKAAWVPKQNLEVLVMSFEPFFVGDVFYTTKFGKAPCDEHHFCSDGKWAMNVKGCLSCAFFELSKYYMVFLRAPVNTPVWYIHFFSRCLVWKHVLESIDMVK